MELFPRSSRPHCARLLIVSALMAAPLTSGAQANKPSFAGPSTARAAQAATFNGSGFAPNSAVSVSVTAAGGAEAHFGAVVRADGSLSHTLVPSVAGPHTLKVLDSSGKVLVTTFFHATP